MKICPYCAEDVRDEALKCKHCGSWMVAPPPAGAKAPSWFAARPAPAGQFLRSRDGMLFGVCGGLGNYLGIDPVWLRLILAIATFFTAGLGFVIYLIFAMIVPLEPAPDPAKPPGSAQDLP